MTEKQQKTKKALIIYCICLFTCAVALIFLVWFMQDRSATELNEAETQAMSLQAQHDKVRTENARLNDSVNSLTKEVEALRSSNENLTKQVEAEKKLVELLSLKAQKKNSDFKTKLAAFEEAKYADFLSPESLEAYNTIIK